MEVLAHGDGYKVSSGERWCWCSSVHLVPDKEAQLRRWEREQALRSLSEPLGHASDMPERHQHL